MQNQRHTAGLLMVLVVALLAPVASFAVEHPFLHGLFSDNVVLQRGVPIPVWGWSSPGASVHVSMAGSSNSAVAGSDGKWIATIGPFADGGPFTLTVSGPQNVTVNNVLVGDVWLCSGQSNMEMGIGAVNNGTAEIAAADYPRIRLMTIPYRSSAQPYGNVETNWYPCSPTTIWQTMNGAGSGFSAAAYFFGRAIHTNLNIPIGLINSSAGGTAVEAWSSQLPAGRSGRDLYNGMISPLAPFPIKGVIWYQGEANAGNASEYQTMLRSMITGWRSVFQVGDFPFLLVQLTSYGAVPSQPSESAWSEVRDAQLAISRSVTNTAMAVTIDIGNPADIHPGNKQDVGRRLSLAALATVYGTNVEYSGPIYREMVREGTRIRVKFDHVGAGLVATGTTSTLKGFSIAGANKSYVWANATIDGNDILVWSDSVPQPLYVRYAWGDSPECNLFNQAGLPASPFRTSTEQVPQGALWRYDDRGMDNGTAWTGAGVIDTNWTIGTPPFGYAAANTVVSNSLWTLASYGPAANNKYLTTYFRRTIFLTDTNLLPASIPFHAEIDDGAILYVNGVEVWRTNMPAGSPNYRTVASANPADVTNEFQFTLPSGIFANGTNELAVELHQSGTNTSDALFSLWADGLVSGTAIPFLTQSGSTPPVWTNTTATTDASPWIAYNDFAWGAGQASGGITVYGMGDNGPLLDHSSGHYLNAKVTSSGVNASLWNYSAAGTAPSGTPAAQLLPTNIVDCLHNYAFDSGTVTFSALSPTNLYTFVLYANRDGGYTDRYTTVAIQDVDSFENNSTTGAASQGASSATLSSGSSHGNVFKFDNVNPGTNGTVVFQLTGYKPCLNAFMVRTPSTGVVVNPVTTYQQLTNGSVWKYADNGVDWGSTAWAAASYAQETNWPVGRGPLGYGNAGSDASNTAATILHYGSIPSNKYVTTYFRKSIFVTDINLLPATIAFNAQVDDGAVVYLNGTPVWYYFMTNSGVTYQTLAQQQKGGGETNIFTFTVPRSSFVTGTNLIAVEVHQGGTGSSDLYFNLWADDLAGTSTVPVMVQQGTFPYSTNQSPASSNSDWTAYNDAAWHQDATLFGGAGVEPNASNYTTNSPWGAKTSGTLVDTNGQAQSVQVTFSGVAATILARNFSFPAGSDAETVFAGRIGTNNVANWTAGTVTMTLSGMDTSRQYNVVLWANRGGDTEAYSNRFTDIAISGAPSFQNHSSAGVEYFQSAAPGDGTRMRSAWVGKVARYDNINPGSDGVVSFLMTAGADATWPSNGPYVTNGYLEAFMVQTVPLATFTDMNTNGILDTWEIQHFGSTTATNGAANQDADHDGFSNYSEYRAGTDPTNASSLLVFRGESQPTATNNKVVLTWPGVTGKTYALMTSTNIVLGVWVPQYTGIPGVQPDTVQTANISTIQGYWRIKVE